MSFKNRIMQAFPVLSEMLRRTKAPITQILVTGAVAGDVTVSGIEKDDQIVSVIDLTDITDLTSQFIVSGANTINNDGGTDTGTAATKATGEVTFTRSDTTDAVTIPSGTEVSDGTNVFVTTEDGDMAAGTGTVTVAIEAEVAGSAGNVDAATITTIVSTVDADSVTNASATTGGADATGDKLLVTFLTWGE